MSAYLGYEPIPDVENGDGVCEPSSFGAQTQHQADLLWALDSAIDKAKLELNLPQVSPNELTSQGAYYIASLFAPTITALCALGAAWLLGQQAIATDRLNEWVNECFPYISAVTMFASSIRPIQNRFMSAIDPVLTSLEDLEGRVTTAVSEIGVKVDEIIDGIQNMVHEELAPKRIILQKASASAHMNEKLFPGIDIPDPDDIDRELDEAQGVVGVKIKEAQKQLEINQYIPRPLRSADSFYWHVVFPFVLLALGIQLMETFFDNHMFITMSGKLRLVNVTEISESENVTGYDEMVFGKVQEVEQTLDQYQEDVQTTIDNARSLVASIVHSYIIAALQIAFLYVITSQGVKAWLLNQSVKVVTNETTRMLRQCGIGDAMEDVLGTKMTSVRNKMLLVFRVYDKIETAMDKLVNLPAASAVLQDFPLGPEGTASTETPKKSGYLSLFWK